MVTTGLDASFPSSLLGPELCPGHMHREGVGETKICPAAVLRLPLPFLLKILLRGGPFKWAMEGGTGGTGLIKHLIISQFLVNPCLHVPVVKAQLPLHIG